MIQLLVQGLIMALLTGLAGIIWLVFHNSFDDHRQSDDNR